MKKIFTLLFALTVIPLSSQNWQYAFKAKGFSSMQSVLCEDKSMYFIGRFADSCTLKNLDFTSVNEQKLIIAKISATGDILWTNFFSAETIAAAGIVTKNDHLFLAANFTGTLSGLQQDTSNSTSCFISEISSSGTMIAYKKESSSGSCKFSGLTLSPSGEILAGGVYTGTANVSGQTLTVNQDYGSFLVKYSSIGVPSMVKNFSSGGGSLSNVQCDQDGNIYFSAAFMDSVIINNDTVIYLGMEYEYASQLWQMNAQGKVMNKRITGVYFIYMNDYTIINSLGDHARLLNTGCNHCTSGVTISKHNIYQDGHLWKYSYGPGYSSGAPNQPPPPSMSPRSITSDNNLIYYSAAYSGPIAINSGTIHGPGGIIASMDHNGNYFSLIDLKWTDLKISDVKNNVLGVTGSYFKKLTLGTHQLDSVNGDAQFVALLTMDAVNVKEITNHDLKINLYPNPSNGLVSLEGVTENTKVEIYDARGRRICAATGCKKMDLSSYDDGMYMIRINDGSKTNSSKIVIVH